MRDSPGCAGCKNLVFGTRLRGICYVQALAPRYGVLTYNKLTAVDCPASSRMTDRRIGNSRAGHKGHVTEENVMQDKPGRTFGSISGNAIISSCALSCDAVYNFPKISECTISLRESLFIGKKQPIVSNVGLRSMSFTSCFENGNTISVESLP